MTKNREVLFAIVTVLWIVAPAGAQDREGNARISINPSQEYQRIQGFGVNYTGPYFRNDRKAMFNMLIDDLGC
jgi:O-glycosyl hydrolase